MEERKKEKETERDTIRAKEMVDAAAAAATGQTVTGKAGGVAQIVKPRPPPLWTGQKFDKLKVEVTGWRDHGRGNDEEKFLNLIESLKKNEAIKAFVSRTLIEIVGETRTVDKVLETMRKKFK